MYSFKELMITPIEDGEDEYLKYRAMKRRKHMYEATIPAGQTAMTKKPDLTNKDKKTMGKIADLMKRANEAAPKIDQDKFAAHMAKNQKPKKMSSTQKALSDISKRANEDNEESTDEALSMKTRMKRSRDMKRNKNKLGMARKRMMKRVANPARIKKRARKQARDMIYKKLTKGIPRSDLTPAKKRELEKRIDKMKPRVSRLTRKIMPQVRQRAHGK